MSLRLISAAVFASLACHHRPSQPYLEVPGMRVRAETHLVGKDRDTLQVWITGKNKSRERQSFGFSTCPDISMRISSTHFTNGKPTHVWDYLVMSHPEIASGEIATMCSGGMATGVMPGDSVTFTFLSVPVARILGDSLPPARYRVVAYPKIYYLGGLCAGEVDLPAPKEASNMRARNC